MRPVLFDRGHRQNGDAMGLVQRRQLRRRQLRPGARAHAPTCVAVRSAAQATSAATQPSRTGFSRSARAGTSG